MPINKKIVDNVLIAEIIKNFDIENSTKIKKNLEDFIKEGNKHIVIDLTPLDFISSTAIGVIAQINRKARHHGSEIAIVNISKKIENLLKITEITKIVNVYDSKDKAIEYFKSNS